MFFSVFAKGSPDDEATTLTLARPAYQFVHSLAIAQILCTLKPFWTKYSFIAATLPVIEKSSGVAPSMLTTAAVSLSGLRRGHKTSRQQPQVHVPHLRHKSAFRWWQNQKSEYQRQLQYPSPPAKISAHHHRYRCSGNRDKARL